jgi:hypothetical protein
MQLSNDLKVFLSIGIAGAIICAIAYGVYSGDWKQFIICAPFAIALAPGYLTLLPRGGMRHGNICECNKRDSTCEFRFWIEHCQKVFLFMPLALASVFLQAFVNSDLQRAILETSAATAAMLFYGGICVYSFYLLTRNRTTERE